VHQCGGNKGGELGFPNLMGEILIGVGSFYRIPTTRGGRRLMSAPLGFELGKDFFLTLVLRLGVQEEDDSGSVGGVSCCWAKVDRCVC
jgi:hypothetical protein